jgi:hypothetical protein
VRTASFITKICAAVILQVLLVGCGGNGGQPEELIPAELNPHPPAEVATITGMRCVSAPLGADGTSFRNTYIDIYSDGTERIQSVVDSKKDCG